MNVNIPITIGGLNRTTADSYGKSASSPGGSTSGTAESRPTEALLPSELESVESTPDTAQEADENETTQSLADEAKALREQSEKANEYLVQAGTSLRFEVSEQTGRTIITVIDSETEEVVRTVPPETMNRLSEQVTQMRGLLFSQTG